MKGRHTNPYALSFLANLPLIPEGLMDASGSWYGLPILALDLVAIGATACGIRFDAPGQVFMIAAPVLVLGGPLAHLWNTHGRMALASLALRLLLPLALAFLGMSASNTLHPARGNIGDIGLPMTWASIGLAVGFLVATSIDVTVLSGSTRPGEQRLVLVTLGAVGVSFVTLLLYQWK